MKKSIQILIVCVTLMFGCIGCEEFFLGAGAGVAGKETLQSWKTNLETKKVELQKQYDAVLAEIESAPDPNALALAKKKFEIIQGHRIANESALFTVTSILEYPQEGKKDDKKDFLASVVIGGVLLGYEILTKRKLNQKYVSAKAGQAVFEAANPEPGKELYKDIGIERRARGL